MRSISAHRVVDLPEPVGPDDQHQAFVQEAELGHLLPDAELLDRHDLRRDDAAHGHRPLAVPRRVDAEAGETRDLVGEIRIAGLLPFRAIPLGHDRQQHQRELIPGDRRPLLSLDLAVGAEHRRFADPHVQVRRLARHQLPEELHQARLGRAVLIFGELAGERRGPLCRLGGRDGGFDHGGGGDRRGARRPGWGAGRPGRRPASAPG